MLDPTIDPSNPHLFQFRWGIPDGPCTLCGKADRDPIHNTMSGAVDSPEAEQTQGFMVMNDAFMPTVEWAEGVKAMMIERGWSPESAETFALDMLRAQATLLWANIKKEMGL